MPSNGLDGNDKWKIVIQASEMALIVLHFGGIFEGRTQNQPLILDNSFSQRTHRHRCIFPVSAWSESY